VRIRWDDDYDVEDGYFDPLQWHFDHPVHVDDSSLSKDERELYDRYDIPRRAPPPEELENWGNVVKKISRISEEAYAAHDQLRGLCGRRGCAARLATSETGETRARLHSGLLFDEEASIYRMSARASEQWKRARLQGKRLEEFSPTARHPRKRKQGITDRKLDRMLQLEAALPANVECPVCGAINLIPPPPLRLDET